MYARTSDRPTFTQLVLLLAITIAVASALATQTSAQRRPRTAQSTAVPRTSNVAGLVTRDLATGGETPESLVQALVGSGTVVSNVRFTGAPVAAGTFSGGGGIIGFDRGIILGSGDVNLVVGPDNVREDTSVGNSMPGDPDLDAVLSLFGYPTMDAALLEFDLECPAGNTISFQCVFSSEEYDNSVTFQFNDGFACFVNGENIALIPGTDSPIAIQTVNCGRPYHPPDGVNCDYYITNDCDSLGLGFPCTHIATEMDGLTVVLSLTGALHPGTNHIKLGIADTADDGYDSNVFIRGQSFECSSTAPVFEEPSPCGQVVEAWAEEPLDFQVVATATNGFPTQAVTLSVAGDTTPLAGGTFVPPLPVGPTQPVSTQFHWTPTAADVGLYHLVFTAIDQFQKSADCDVAIRVSPAPGTDVCQPGSGTVIACPCGNPPAASPGGCDNSSASGGARLRSIGAASIGHDTLVFVTSAENPTALSVVMQGDDLLSSGVVYGQGVRCVGGRLKRLYVKNASEGSITAPQAQLGELPVSVRSAQKGDPLAAGATRTYAVYYRDPVVFGGCPATSTFNITQTQAILWSP